MYTKGLLEGDDNPHEVLCEKDPETGATTPIDREWYKQCVEDYLEIILWCKKADKGVFMLTYDDYLAMPAKLMDAYEIFKSVKAENTIGGDRPVTVNDMVQMFGKKDGK